MGTDIHQINILSKRSHGRRQIEIADGDYIRAKHFKDSVIVRPYTVIPELVPGRWYDMFSVLSGVRGNGFQITENVHEYIPIELKQALRSDDVFQDFYSFTWYYVSDLAAMLEATWQKIMIVSEADAILDDHEMAEEHATLGKGAKILADKLKSCLANEACKDDIVFFFYDS